MTALFVYLERDLLPAALLIWGVGLVGFLIGYGAGFARAKKKFSPSTTPAPAPPQSRQ